MLGLIVAAYGKRYTVEVNGKTLQCVTRAKKSEYACGDRVTISSTSTNEGVIETLEPRTTLLHRSNAYKSKFLAANVTQAVIVTATTPAVYEALLNRCLIAAEAAHIQTLIVLNKCDIGDLHTAREMLAIYRDIGYRVLEMTARQDVSTLESLLQGHCSVLVGQSGMGKSTILNALLPQTQARTQEISSALNSGKHTTTATRLYHLDTRSQLIDSPGMQEFGLYHIDFAQLEQSFTEFKPYLGRCRFQNCRHDKEPDCALKVAMASGKIAPQRLALFNTFAAELRA